MPNETHFPKRLFFSKNERLCSKKHIQKLFQQGAYLNAYPLIFRYCAVPNIPHHQILIAIPKKKIKKAVQRNLLKRRLRELYRINKNLLTHQSLYRLHIAIIYQSDTCHSFTLLEEIMIKSMKKIDKEYQKLSTFQKKP